MYLFFEMEEDKAPQWGSIWTSTSSAESTLVLNSNNTWSSAWKEMESAYQSPSSTSFAINTII